MDYLTTSEVARLLHLSESGTRKWEKEGRLKAIKTARGRRLFKRKDVEKLVPKKEVEMKETAPAIAIFGYVLTILLRFWDMFYHWWKN